MSWWTSQKAKQCAVCGGRSNLKCHHVVLAQVVLRAGGNTQDPTNSLTVCLVCHADHHGIHPIELYRLRDVNYEFAADLLGLGAAHQYFARRYAGRDQRHDQLLELAEGITA
jgi:hypothetical protein